MDVFWTLAGCALIWLAVGGFSDIAKIYMTNKVKIAEAERDAEKYKLETARINSNR